MEFNIERKVWVSDGNNFRVEVTHWFKTNDNRNKWNVYVYIYPKHFLFDKITSESFILEVNLPLHCGVSFHKWRYDKDGKVLSKQIGSDYQHLHDDDFENFSTKEDAYEVFNDADDLMQALKDADAMDLNNKTEKE